MSWAQIVANFDRKITPLTEPPPPTPDHKRCKECEKVLPLSSFYDRGDGRKTARCKPCYIQHQKGFYKK